MTLFRSCLLTVATLVLAVVLAVPAHAERSAASLPGGLTRNSLYEPDPPEPTPHSVRRTAHARQRPKSPTDPKDRVFPAYPSGRGSVPVVTIRARTHRNPVVSFVYWWNGWVIRRLHTKIGTVMLGTIGAKS